MSEPMPLEAVGPTERRLLPFLYAGPYLLIGLLILVFPGASLVVLAWILGLWLIFFGLSAVATGLTARKLLAKVRDAAMYWP